MNATLATLGDTDAMPGSDMIAETATDSLGGAASAKAIIVAVPNAPLITAPAGIIVARGVSEPVAGISLSEIGAVAGETFTVPVTDVDGRLSATGATGSGTTSVSVTGTLTQVNAALATLHDTDGTPTPDTLTVAAIDSLGNTAAPQTIAVTVNGAPLLAAPATAVLGQGRQGGIPGVSVSETGTTTGETFTVTAADTAGLLFASGVGVTGSGTTSFTITGTLAQVDADLATLKATSGGADTITLTATALAARPPRPASPSP